LVLLAALSLLFARSARAQSDLNACGCRQTGQGLCYCEKKSKCGCPGECEPKGCEERRSKQLEKEIQAETKKAQEAARRQGREHRSADDSDDDDDRMPRAALHVGNKSPGDGKSSRASTAKMTAKMTAAQKKELARLLGLYLAEHPDHGGRAVEQVRSDVASASP
jgi:hypothetical protein